MHTGAMFGIPVVTNPYLRDGMVVAFDGGSGQLIVIGTAPLSVREAAGREARFLVRRGLADVLAWLGEPVETEPPSARILARIRALEEERCV